MNCRGAHDILHCTLHCIIDVFLPFLFHSSMLHIFKKKIFLFVFSISVSISIPANPNPLTRRRMQESHMEVETLVQREMGGNIDQIVELVRENQEILTQMKVSARRNR